MEVSPFAIWEKELPRIIHDERYTCMLRVIGHSMKVIIN